MQTDQEYVIAPKGSTVQADFFTDGVHDEVEINHALEVAATCKGTVRLLAGTYVVDPSVGISLRSNVSLFGVGPGSVITIPNAVNAIGNILKGESVSDVVVADLKVDGNRDTQSTDQGVSTNYGVYIAGSFNCHLANISVVHCTGVGIHFYNTVGSTIDRCYSANNSYHGYEIEQSIGCTVQSSRGIVNSKHGISIAPGEQGGTGSSGISVIGNTFENNTEYGINADAANDGMSPYLSAGILIEANNIRNNGIRGITIYKNDNFIIRGNFITGSQQIGLYLYQAQNCLVQGNLFMDNGQETDNSYDDILLEGYNDNNSHPAKNNLISGNSFIYTQSNKPRYAVSEATANDGPNVILNNMIPVDSSTTPSIHAQNTDSSLSASVPGVLMINPNGTHTMPAGGAGIDNAFSGVMRLINDMGGETQFVNTHAAFTAYVGGAKRLGVETDGGIHQFAPGTIRTPSDANMLVFWLDEAANQLKVRVKYADGSTVKAGSISLS